MADAEALRPIGIHAERVNNSSDFRERAFVEHWQTKEADTVELLMRKQCARDDPRAVGYFMDTNTRYMRPLGPTTHRDRVVAETVIQWLGSNCGMAFLQETLRSIGGDIKWPPRPGTAIPEKDSLETPTPHVKCTPAQSATVTTDRDKVLALLQELSCGSYISTSGNSQYVAVTSPAKQGQPGVVFEFDRIDLSFSGMYGEAI